MPGGETQPLKGLSAGIVKAARLRVKEALKKLDAIPMVDGEHIAVPWPITKRPKIDSELWSDSDIKALRINALTASQSKLEKKQVADYIRSQGAPEEEGKRALANVYATSDRNVIIDGHHRLAALWLLGAEVANTWYLEE